MIWFWLFMLLGSIISVWLVSHECNITLRTITYGELILMIGIFGSSWMATFIWGMYSLADLIKWKGWGEFLDKEVFERYNE